MSLLTNFQDLANTVKLALDRKADKSSLTGKEDTANKVTSLSSSSTDTEYPSAKCVYDELQNIPSMPSGTADGQILVWDNTNQVWTVKPKWQMIYQPVEYIESHGATHGSYSDSGQYIDTEANQISGIIIDFEMTTANDDDAAFGCMKDNNTDRHDVVCYSGAYYSFGSGADPFFKISDDPTNVRMLLEQGVTSNELKVNGNTIGSFQPFTYSTSYNFYLFGRNFANRYRSGNVKIYSCKLYKGNTLVRDFVPCVNVYTGEGVMFDKVNQKAYSNKGSGSFIVGSAI